MVSYLINFEIHVFTQLSEVKTKKNKHSPWSVNHYSDSNDADFTLNYIHFEITGYPCNLIGSQQCDLFLNRTIFLL